MYRVILHTLPAGIDDAWKFEDLADAREYGDARLVREWGTKISHYRINKETTTSEEVYNSLSNLQSFEGELEFNV